MKLVLPIFAALTLVSTCLGCHRAAAPPEEKVPRAPVKWESTRQLFLEEWTELVGTAQPLPDHAARITSPVEGRVSAVLQAPDGRRLVEGQLVQKGDVLVQLDTALLIASREKADAAKKVQQAEKEAADWAVAQASLEVKRLNELKRQQEAQPRDRIQLMAAIELEKAEVALNVARANARVADRKLEAAQKELSTIDQQIGLYALAAPRTGRFGRLQVVIGQTLAVGTAVAEVVDVENQIDILCFVPSATARLLALGQPARFASVADSAGPSDGSIVFIADHAELETGLIAVKARFDNRAAKLRANTVARLRVLTRPGKACWAVPEAALMEDQDPPALVIIEDIETKTNTDGKEEQIGKARRLRATIGVRDRVLRQVEILRLEDPEKKWRGDIESAQIVVEKGQGLQTGDPVRLEQEEE